jgi:hypothetical protein
VPKKLHTLKKCTPLLKNTLFFNTSGTGSDIIKIFVTDLDSAGQALYSEKIHKDKCKNKYAPYMKKKNSYIGWRSKFGKIKKKWNSKIPETKFLLKSQKYAKK